MPLNLGTSSRWIKRVALKEVSLFFASPIGYLFLLVFAGVSLFVFFWAETFFARNIADVRPLFEWMPILLIFLASTLTMRLWSEERRSGTLEHVLTQPVPIWCFVVGKFLGCMALLLIALLVTLPLPISVSLFSNLDWGPVFAGYLAAFLLGAAYISIGLFASARSDNQIVSLIISVALCGAFYLLGSSLITDLFGTRFSELLNSASTGSRFESITRGIADLRDLTYYLSIALVFLAFNTYMLERERWAVVQDSPHHRGWKLIVSLIVANAIIANVWLSQINSMRVDLTEGNQYSVSDATRTYISQLQEPLLIRGYFSNKTHPLLAPLVPRMKDLIEEYGVAGQGKVRIEFVDPQQAPEMEEEANRKYAIEPVPFQVADRYESSIVSSYFNILVSYGDEYQVLGFRDLIDVKSQGEADLDVQLRNPEYDLTSAIKKVLKSYQSAGNLFDTVKGTLEFNAYVSDESRLPETLRDYKAIVEKQVEATEKLAQGRFKVDFFDPDAEGGRVAQQIAQDFGFQPMATSLFSNQQFYYYMTLSDGETFVQLPLDDLTDSGFERNLDSAIKRFASGFTKTVALVLPEQAPVAPQMRQFTPPGASYRQLEQFLGSDLNIEREDLGDGSVSPSADILVVLAPKDLDKNSLFAIDQFLMRGGTIFIASSPYTADIGRQRLSLNKLTSGLDKWLSHHGITIDDQVVMDSQNAAFPAPVTRNVGGFSVQEVRMLDYPYFPDIREDGLDQSHPMTSGLPQLITAWASPINVDSDKNGQRKITELIRSSSRSWLSDSLDILPSANERGQSGFERGDTLERHVLGIINEGQFDSFFAKTGSPLLEGDDESEAKPDTDGASEAESSLSADDSQDAESSLNAEGSIVSGVISRSPQSAQIVLIGSNDFLRDSVVQITGSATGSRNLGGYQLLANAIDWALEDESLLSIRSRGKYNRTLPPMERETQRFWEISNYAFAAFAIFLIAMVRGVLKRRRVGYFKSLVGSQS